MPAVPRDPDGFAAEDEARSAKTVRDLIDETLDDFEGRDLANAGEDLGGFTVPLVEWGDPDVW